MVWLGGHLHTANVFFFFLILFIYLFMAVLGLRFCARAFSSCSKWGPLFITVRGPLTIAASHYRGLSCCGAQAPDAQAQQLWLTGPCSAARGIFPDQGSNPCALHWQADSQPLRHQGSPTANVLSFLISVLKNLLLGRKHLLA